MKGLSE